VKCGCLTRVDDHLDAVGVAVGHALGDFARSRIVVAHNDEDLEVRVVAADQTGERVLEHGFLVASGDDQ
jgi:hypothetical protein